MSKTELKVKSIRNGTVIDHIKKNRALNILSMLNLPDDETSIMVAINVESPDMERKDIIKIEGRELSQEEVDKLVLLAQMNLLKTYSMLKVKNQYF